MSDPKYPYETRLNILHRQLEVIGIQKFAETIEFKWFNQTLCKTRAPERTIILMVESAGIVPTGDA